MTKGMDSMTARKLPRKPGGCLCAAGWGCLALAFLLVAFGVFYWIDDDRRWTERQQAENAAMQAWQEADDARCALAYRLDSLTDRAFAAGNVARVRVLTDSLLTLVSDEMEEDRADDPKAEVRRLDSLRSRAFRAGRREEVASYSDSIFQLVTDASAPRPEMKTLGFPLGGLVSVFVFLLALVPFCLGVVLLVVYYSRRSRYRLWARMQAPPPPSAPAR